MNEPTTSTTSTTTAQPMQFTRVYNNPGVAPGIVLALCIVVAIAVVMSAAAGAWLFAPLRRG